MTEFDPERCKQEDPFLYDLIKITHLGQKLTKLVVILGSGMNIVETGIDVALHKPFLSDLATVGEITIVGALGITAMDTTRVFLERQFQKQ